LNTVMLTAAASPKAGAPVDMPRCPACSNHGDAYISAPDYNRRLSPQVFAYFECTACKLIFCDPVPDDLGAYYTEDYYDLPADLAAHGARARALQQWKIDTVLRFAQGGRLAEIGPAYGLFAHLAKVAGFDVTGIEMDARCCTYLRDVVGITAVQSNDAAAALPALEPFDVIVLWQAVEHLPNYHDVLRAAAAQLKPGGVLILDTPNPAAFQFKVLGRRWVHLDAPRHVVLIPVETLKAQAEAAGLEPVWLTASNISANGFNGWGWAHTFKNYFGDNILGSAAHFGGRVLGKLLIPVERTGWRGSTYTAVFRKRAIP